MLEQHHPALELVVVDEWHELLASKRGVQTELALARLRHFRPGLRTLGLSATLGNLDTARDTLLGLTPDRFERPGRVIRGLVPKGLHVDSLIPESMERFPWSGQIGLRLLPESGGAHGPFFTRNIAIVTDSEGRTGLGEVPGGEAAGATLGALRRLCEEHAGTVPVFLHVLLPGHEVVVRARGVAVDAER